jgi:hypothetical protein
MLYERTALSKRKMAVIAKAHEKQRLIEMKIVKEEKKSK